MRAAFSTEAPQAKADDWNQKTIFTFSGPVEIPGQALTAGTYVFKLADSQTNRNIVQNGGAAVLFTKGVWRWLTNASWQRMELKSAQTFPATRDVDHAFEDVLPSMTLSATFANRRNLRLAWNTAASPPTITQLQNVVDNSNPLSLTAGNPDLRETHNNNFSLRISEADPSASSSPAGNPRASRAAHIAGSQETLTSRLTCRAAQEAAAARAFAAWCAVAALVGLSGRERPR